MTPPSARTAEPLIAVAWVLATNVTTAATSSVVSKRFKSEEGRTVEKNCCSISAFVTPCCLAMLSTKAPTPSEAVGPARMEFTVTPVPATDSEEHTSELQSRQYLVCRLLLEKKKKNNNRRHMVHNLYE